ncbi:hypothetical protein LV84_01613 [Algoriphagus ratkowskyi]|uniref:Uncharacterized protein n=1 Tax=Algoriphagus ratkowskyi TaxID=57028 RepID=A0A2W7S694_9BACT|nr:hypothetical protein LV84_01613 [Algoriphagus ratkowskyi]
MMLKAILVSLLLLGFSDSRDNLSEEYDLINYLVSEIDDNSLNADFLDWKILNYDSYEKLNPKNSNFAGEILNFDFNEIFNTNQRKQIDSFLKSSQPSTLDLDLLKCGKKLKKNKDYVRGRTTYSFSYPIISEGLDKIIYGIVIESKSFEADNGETKLKVFQKNLILGF